jgi:hypothetical protein
LGRPIPDAYEVRLVRSYGLIVDLIPTGYWVGGDSVLVRTNPDGLIFEIDVRYPAGFDPVDIETGLLSDFGPGRPDAEWPAWWNRTTRARLSVGDRTRVVLVDPRMRYF